MITFALNTVRTAWSRHRGQQCFVRWQLTTWGWATTWKREVGFTNLTAVRTWSWAQLNWPKGRHQERDCWYQIYLDCMNDNTESDISFVRPTQREGLPWLWEGFPFSPQTESAVPWLPSVRLVHSCCKLTLSFHLFPFPMKKLSFSFMRVKWPAWAWYQQLVRGKNK